MVDETLIALLRGQHWSTEALVRTDALLRIGVSPEVLCRAVTGASPSYKTITDIMAGLEKVASADAVLGLKLMIGLYSIASDFYAYDVCDAIDLWLEHEGTGEVLGFILGILDLNLMPGMKSKLETWAGILNNAQDLG